MTTGDFQMELVDYIQDAQIDAENWHTHYAARLQEAEEWIDAVQVRLDYIEARLRLASETLDACWRLDQDLRGPTFAYVLPRHRRWVAQREKAADYLHVGWVRAHAYWARRLVDECDAAEAARTYMETYAHLACESERELAQLTGW